MLGRLTPVAMNPVTNFDILAIRYICGVFENPTAEEEEKLRSYLQSKLELAYEQGKMDQRYEAIRKSEEQETEYLNKYHRIIKK
jgi:coenzyme F420-reducing hydrogenase alpha subunit